MEFSTPREAFVARALASLAEPLGFHPVAIARPELAALAELGEHAVVRAHPDGYEQVILIARGNSPADVADAAERAARMVAEKPELTRDRKLRIFLVGIGLGRVAGPERKRLLAEMRLSGDRVVIRRFFLSLDRRQLYARSSPWSFAPGFQINPCDPDENVFVSLVRKDRYLKGPAATVTESQHRSSLAREQLFLAGLTGRRVLVRTILVFNVLVWAALALAGGSSSPAQLLAAGAKSNGLIVAGQYWRLVTPVFLHAGLMHLALNSAGLLFLGEVLERVYGSTQFALVYFIAGIASAAASFCLGREIMVGASGAIFGLAGALVVYGWKCRERIPRRFGAMFGAGLLPIVGLNLLFGALVPGVDNWAHLGGLFAGAVVALALRPLADDPAREGAAAPQRLAALVVLGVVAACVALAARNYATSRDPFETDARWTLSRRVPGGIDLDVPASWPEASRAADEAAWRASAYAARLEVRAIDAAKDTNAAVGGEFARLRTRGFHLVTDDPYVLVSILGDLYTRGRVDLRLAGPHASIRQQSFLLLGGRLVSIGVEFPDALAAPIRPVLDRITSSLPTPQ